MAVTPQFSASDVRKVLEEKKRRFEQATLLTLSKVGEDFITNARSNDTYIDQTGNLRSSVGYIILKNGEQVLIAGFEIVKQGTEGVVNGPKIASEIAAKYPIGFVLIVVAGMEYAAAVEAKGYDVLTASGIKAENDLKRFLKKLQKA